MVNIRSGAARRSNLEGSVLGCIHSEECGVSFRSPQDLPVRAFKTLNVRYVRKYRDFKKTMKPFLKLISDTDQDSYTDDLLVSAT